MGGQHLRRVVDVGRVRTLIFFWCRQFAGWVSESRLVKRPRDVCKSGDLNLAYQLRKLEQGYLFGRRMGKGPQEGVHVQGRRVPTTESEFQTLFDSQYGLWHNMERKLVEIHNGALDLFDEKK